MVLYTGNRLNAACYDLQPSVEGPLTWDRSSWFKAAKPPLKEANPLAK